MTEEVKVLFILNSNHSAALNKLCTTANIGFNFAIIN